MPGSIEATLREDLGAALGASAAGVVCVYLFGSQAGGHSHRESDVDVAVLLDQAAFRSREERFEQRLRMSGAVARILGRNDIDLIVLNDVPPGLAARVATEGRLLYCSDPGAERRFRRDALLRAADLEPFLRRMRRIALQTLRR